MGSPLSLIVENLYIEKFEKHTMDSFPRNLKYGSATWTTHILSGLMELDKFFNHLNNLNHNIQFIVETEKDGCIPILDVMISENRALTSFSPVP